MTEEILKLIDSVIAASAKAVNIPVGDVITEGRQRERVRARYIGWLIISDLTTELKYPNGIKIVTLASIGEAYGGFDHATVLYGRNTARSKVWGDGINPPLKSWAKAYEEVLAEVSPEIAEIIGKNDDNVFFPYTPVGHANARKFLQDLGKTGFKHLSMETLVTFANEIVNLYKS